MLSAYISPSDIKVNLESSEKEESFAELLELLVAKHPEIDREEALNALVLREEKMSTAVFPKVAVPHGVIESVGKTAIAIGISRSGIEFESPEGNSDFSKDSSNPVVNIIFEIIFEEKDTDSHLHVLKDILQLVSNPDFVKNVLESKTSQDVFDLIEALEG